MVSKGEVEIGSLTRKNSSLDAEQTLQLSQQLKARGLSSISPADSLENEAKAISFTIDSKNIDFPNHTSITFISENMYTEDALTSDCSAFMNATLTPPQLIGPKVVKEGRRGRRKSQNHIFRLFPNASAAHNQKIVYERKLRKIDHSEIKSVAVRQPLAQSQSNTRKYKRRNRIPYIETGSRTEILNLEQCISLINGKSGALVQENENNDPLLTFEQNVRSPFVDVLEAGSSATIFDPAMLVSAEIVNPQPSPVKDSDVTSNENPSSKKENYSEHPGQLCRLCANSGDAMVYIFGDAGVQLGLRKKINSWLPTHVSRSDPLPKQVCSRCIQKLTECHDFALSCAEAEKKLNNLVKRKKFSCHTDGVAEADGNGISLEETEQERLNSEQVFSSVEDMDNSVCSFVENGAVDTKLQDPFLTDHEENEGFFSEDSSEVVLETVIGDESVHSNKYGCPLCCEGNMHTVQRKTADILQVTEDLSKSVVKEEVDEQSCNSTTNDRSIKDEDESQENTFEVLDSDSEIKRNYNNISEIDSEEIEPLGCVEVEYEIPEKKVRVVFENNEPTKQDASPVACWVCGEALESLYDCLAHGLQTHGDTEDGIYPCSQCEESFCTSEEMRQHFSSSHFPILEKTRKRKAGVLKPT